MSPSTFVQQLLPDQIIFLRCLGIWPYSGTLSSSPDTQLSFFQALDSPPWATGGTFSAGQRAAHTVYPLRHHEKWLKGGLRMRAGTD
ncbi:hypothetical protein ElyMa_002360400 [Elysia marginata]|uniref:Uncharacterized protein n=1 Tax=Elysia marginata TaxID=1093978 RepID=A0AAV4GAG2_9GAST|nr:hypothetical protein ElyMa_002360400 [Elysia marginata]